VGVSTVEASKLIFALFEALMEENETVPGQTDNPTLRQAVYKINSRLDEPLTVTLLADELRVSRRHLTHLFQSEMGISPYQFIMQQKNLLACRLLKSTTLSVSEIALRVGYATPTHFSRAFQRMLRMPPREFRRNGTIPCW
jgi:transcriptional regulator GlxA family with amidase domain